MLNIQVGKLRKSEVLEHIGEYASYYNEGDYKWFEEHQRGEEEYCPQPCIEVFCYYDKELVEKNTKELTEKLKPYESELFVDFEHFTIENFSRIMIYVNQDTELYKVVALAKTISQYGDNKYNDVEAIARQKLANIERIKCKILKNVLEAELEYCFDVTYNQDLAFTERQEGFLRVSNDYINNYEIKDFIEYYGLSFFTDQNIITQSELDFLIENKLINSENC